MGLYCTPSRLYLSSKYQLWQLDNVLESGNLYQEYDKLYIPRIGYTTGDIDIHDIAVDKNNQIIFISTLFNCIATVSATVANLSGNQVLSHNISMKTAVTSTVWQW